MHLISIICLFSLSFLSFFMHLISVFSLLWIISTGGAPKRQLTYELKYMGIVDDKKWCPFFIQPSENPTFCTQKRPFSVFFGAKKMGLQTPESNNGQLVNKFKSSIVAKDSVQNLFSAFADYLI